MLRGRCQTIPAVLSARCLHGRAIFQLFPDAHAFPDVLLLRSCKALAGSCAVCVPYWIGVLPAAFLPLLPGLERRVYQDRVRVALQARGAASALVLAGLHSHFLLQCRGIPCAGLGSGHYSGGYLECLIFSVHYLWPHPDFYPYRGSSRAVGHISSILKVRGPGL